MVDSNDRERIEESREEMMKMVRIAVSILTFESVNGIVLAK